MSSADPRLEELFHAALDLPPADRAEFLDRRCAGDRALRDEVDSLLAASTDADDFLEAPAHRGFDELDTSLTGRRFGRYRIARRIASGGMGSVFEAEQDEPRRAVALKLLRAGVVNPRALERFRMEAEVLGRLRHPGIAQVYEAGVSEIEQAAPWIAMEFVPGARNLLEHVTDAAPSLDRRIELFLEVCDAVHHGHQKGVIHRDLKPSNVLVDDEGRVKVIDFGVARVVDEERQAMLTVHGELVGTLQYMSPEQCAGNPDLIDVRTDVHALGLLLYEMLCGRRPYDVSGLPLTEAVETVVHREPVRPTRVNPDLPRDLEAVIRKALEKEPAHRYESVASLADDLRRFLRHEPVVARPPGPLHSLRLLARRRPAALFGVVVLAISAAVSAGFAVEARRAQARAEADAATRGQMLEFVLELFDRADPNTAQGEEPRVSDLFDGALERIETRLIGQPRAQLQLLWSIARLQQNLNRHADSLPLIERAVELLRQETQFGIVEEARLLRHRALARQHSGDAAGARADFDAALTILRRERGPEDPKTIACVVEFANYLIWVEDIDEAGELLEGVVRLGVNDDVDIAIAIANLGVVHLRKGDPKRAERFLRDAEARLSGDGVAPSTQLATVQNSLGLVLKIQGRLAEARPYYESSLALYRRLIPDDDKTLATLELNFAAMLVQAADIDEAAPLLESALEKAAHVGDDEVFLQILRQQMNVAAARGRYDEVETLAGRVLERQHASGATTPDAIGLTLLRLGEALLRLDRPDEAEPRLLEAIERFEEQPGFEPATAAVRSLLQEVTEALELRSPDATESPPPGDR